MDKLIKHSSQAKQQGCFLSLHLLLYVFAGFYLTAAVFLFVKPFLLDGNVQPNRSQNTELSTTLRNKIKPLIMFIISIPSEYELTLSSAAWGLPVSVLQCSNSGSQ